MADKVKTIIAALIAVAALVAFYVFNEYSTLLRTIALIVALGVAVAIIAKTERGAAAIAFLRASIVEMKKVVWPNKKETGQTTLIVGVMVFIVGLMLWLFDSLLGWGVRYLTGQGG